MTQQRITVLPLDLLPFESDRIGQTASSRTHGSHNGNSASGEVETGWNGVSTSSTLQQGVTEFPAHRGPNLQYRRGSVWDKYEKCFELDLNGKVDVAISRAKPTRLVIVRPAGTNRLNHKLKMVTQLMLQPSFATCLEIFGSVTAPIFVCEYLNLNLGHVWGVPSFPKEAEVRAIAGQVCCSPKLKLH